MLAVTEEHKRVLTEQPFVAIRCASNLQESLVWAKLPPVEGVLLRVVFVVASLGVRFVGLCRKEISFFVMLLVRSIT